MSLQIKYSKELAKEYGQVAVYLPGNPIEIGDIVTFDYGNNIFGKARPIGSFQKKNSLKNLDVPYIESKPDKDGDTYYFKSNGTRVIEADGNANSNFGNDKLPGLKGEVGVRLSSEGSLFILAINCNKKRIENVADLENMINSNGKTMIWDDTFLVTAVTTASKAIIIQSKTFSSEFLISGDVKGIKSSSANITADATLSVKTTNGDAFVKPWSDNVTLFIEVLRFEKKIFDTEIKTRDLNSLPQSDLLQEIELKSVNIQELIND